jgi:MFS family permease
VTWGEAVSVLRERRFAWYFAARTVSTAGTAMAPVALAFAVLHLTDSAGALAQVLTARTAAMVLFLLVGGVVSDRMSRTTVLQLAHALTAVTQGTAAVLVISGHADLWMITGIEAVNGAASAFTFPAMAGIVPHRRPDPAPARERAARVLAQRPHRDRPGRRRAAGRDRRTGVGAGLRRGDLPGGDPLPLAGPAAST